MPTVPQLERDDLKHPKPEVFFEHPSRRIQKCKFCLHWSLMGKNTCEIVEGTVLEQDWCNQYNPKYTPAF